jgi:hypothetical protein
VKDLKLKCNSAAVEETKKEKPQNVAFQMEHTRHSIVYGCTSLLLFFFVLKLPITMALLTPYSGSGFALDIELWMVLGAP